MGQVVQRSVKAVFPVAGRAVKAEVVGRRHRGWTTRLSQRFRSRGDPWRRGCLPTRLGNEQAGALVAGRRKDASCCSGPPRHRGTPATIFEATAADLLERRQRCLRAELAEGGAGRDGDEPPPPRQQHQQGSADFRARYLGRLSYSRAWAPRQHRRPQHETVTIFDWDDTLLCTSFLMDNPQADIRKQLQSVSTLARQLLTQAKSKGHVFIVTNASDGWVQQSCQTYVPELLPILEQVTVISARSKFASHYPDRHDVWKVQAFLEVQRQLDSDAIANLISVGDSHFEMQAVQAMGNQFAEAVVKTVKLWERPSPEDLRRELELVARDLAHIIDYPTTARIGVERKRKPVESPPTTSFTTM